ncbi:MAG: choice-of-anchor D domain-containing protein, partial [Acidobacteria bacterium]|nr:choice-of-anchor D domain-containing protein [Acidobacteriota bacterium]
LYFSGITVSGDFKQTNGCGTRILKGQSCKIHVTFAPTVNGVRSGTVTISDNALNSPQTIALAGTASAVTVSPRSLALSTPQAVGIPVSLPPVTVTNVGSSALIINGVTAAGDFTQTNTCGSSLGAGQTCSINAAFTPSRAGASSGTLTISDADFTSPQVVNLTGQGTFASFSRPALNFGNQLVNSASASQSVTLTNNGATNLGIVRVTASGDYSQSNTCAAVLVGGADCTIWVTFSPSASGPRPGFVAVNTSDASFVQKIALSGAGQLTASTVTISPHVAALSSMQIVQFTSNISVAWSVDGTPGGSVALGTITPGGLYRPPAASGNHVISAISTADPTQTDTAAVTVTNHAGVFSNRYDNRRSGLNLQEIALTTGNTNSRQFGKLFELPVDGRIYAQPLYVAGVNIPGNGLHNVVYVATEHDSVYAFDADRPGPPLWDTSFINPSAGITAVPSNDVSELGPEFGITGTPVIDLNTGTLYCVAYTSEVGNPIYRLHALDITTGQEKPGSPVVVQASVPGKGSGSVGGTIAFSSSLQKQRCGLLLSNGVVYIAWAVFGAENISYHGWILGYDAATLEQVLVYNNTANAQGGGFWSGGVGPAADSNGDIFVSSGNGTFDVSTGGVDFGDSVTRLRPTSSTLSVVDYFTPYNQASLNTLDLDLGSCAPLILPDQPGAAPHLLVAGGKEGRIYLINRDNMGQYNPTADKVVQELLPGVIGVVFGSPIFWQGDVYFLGAGDVLKAFQLSGGRLSSFPVSTAGGAPYRGRGATLALSANGNQNGILWSVAWTTDQSNAVLHAYNAADVSDELYNSTQAGSRDQL